MENRPIPDTLAKAFTQPSSVFSIDVECVATGTDHNSRDVAQISLVDYNDNIILDLHVTPEKPVVSYLTPLTGLTPEKVQSQGRPLAAAVSTMREHLPQNAILVGQGIGQDVTWLGLVEGQDFEGMVDLTGIYRIWNPKYKSYSVFSQDHLCRVLLGFDTSGSTHDAAGDAVKSMRLFRQYHSYHGDPASWTAAQEKLLAIPPEPSFAKRFPTFEGVCMGNRKTCRCGAPFLG
ncbi:g5068 [Coccomyxa viridis]|uniref:G5068 protein n=1 Tax=Coccomyxa viridis TaxID=1274662 RepID=A0ABP1FRV5_9CHLO